MTVLLSTPPPAVPRPATLQVLTADKPGRKAGPPGKIVHGCPRMPVVLIAGGTGLGAGELLHRPRRYRWTILGSVAFSLLGRGSGVEEARSYGLCGLGECGDQA